MIDVVSVLSLRAPRTACRCHCRFDRVVVSIFNTQFSYLCLNICFSSSLLEGELAAAV
jgi:hypothetical protein